VDAGVRALYVDLISSYVSALGLASDLKPDTKVMLELYSDEILTQLLDFLRHIYRSYGFSHRLRFS